MPRCPPVQGLSTPGPAHAEPSSGDPLNPLIDTIHGCHGITYYLLHIHPATLLGPHCPFGYPWASSRTSFVQPRLRPPSPSRVPRASFSSHVIHVFFFLCQRAKSNLIEVLIEDLLDDPRAVTQVRLLIALSDHLPHAIDYARVSHNPKKNQEILQNLGVRGVDKSYAWIYSRSHNSWLWA